MSPNAYVTMPKGQLDVHPADALPSSSSPAVVNVPATQEVFITAQQGDVLLLKCHSSVLNQEENGLHL